MKHSIFISRNLPADSLLLHFLNENNWDVYHQSLIHIEPIPFKIEKEYDWIFLASSNGAKLLLRSFTPAESTKIGVVGEATAKAVKAFGIFPDFIGKTGDMKHLGDMLARTIGTNTVLFAGAEGGSEKIRSAVPENQRTFLPIYRTVLDTHESIPETDAVFLTSPSNAKSYLKSTSLKGKKVIAIGHTTADFLTQEGVKKVFIPTSPTEKDLIELLKKL